MLKIKDNVDLKELEKYGFIHWDDDKEDYVRHFNSWHYICVTSSTRYIEVYDDEDLGQEAVELFYDMVQDGLIEKVEDRNEEI